MKGDFHVRFRENVRVKFPCVTRLNHSCRKPSNCESDDCFDDRVKTKKRFAKPWKLVRANEHETKTLREVLNEDLSGFHDTKNASR